jgi:hypothetical protein
MRELRLFARVIGHTGLPPHPMNVMPLPARGARGQERVASQANCAARAVKSRHRSPVGAAEEAVLHFRKAPPAPVPVL